MLARTRPLKLFFVPALALIATASAAETPANTRPDLATAIAGTYLGNVISDVNGPSRRGVVVTITRTGPNTVSVTASQRMPPRTYHLRRYANSIQNVPGAALDVLLYEESRTPPMLSLSYDDASWSGWRK